MMRLKAGRGYEVLSVSTAVPLMANTRLPIHATPHLADARPDYAP
jgi:hypothetical protein